MEILIGGDLVPTQSNMELFVEEDIRALLGSELLSIWKAADIRIINLEAPLTDEETPILKCGPNLIAPTKTVSGIKALNPSLITLANNHILDQGDQGLKSTENLLEKHRINYIGVGKNLEFARKPYIIEKENIRIGIYACTENEFSIATETTPGANPFDPLDSLDQIKELKNNCDYVIVLYHGGKEHYRYPSPYLQRLCRKLVEKGADLVICQHSHCIGAKEEYKEKTIVYGQGNFIFDYSNSVYWQTSLLIKININAINEVEFIPIVKNDRAVQLADERTKADILKGFFERSNEIQSKQFVEQKYDEFVRDVFKWYIAKLFGDRFIFRALNRVCNYNLAKKLYTRKALLVIENMIECEAHRELIIKGLKKELGDK